MVCALDCVSIVDTENTPSVGRGGRSSAVRESSSYHCSVVCLVSHWLAPEASSVELVLSRSLALAAATGSSSPFSNPLSNRTTPLSISVWVWAGQPLHREDRVRTTIVNVPPPTGGEAEMTDMRFGTKPLLARMDSLSGLDWKLSTRRAKARHARSTIFASGYVRRFVSMGMTSVTMGKQSAGTFLHTFAATDVATLWMLVAKKSRYDRLAERPPARSTEIPCSWDILSSAIRLCSAKSMYSIVSSLAHREGIAPCETATALEPGSASIMYDRARVANNMRSGLCSRAIMLTSAGTIASTGNPASVSSVPTLRISASSVTATN
eukprot:comp24050_c2_seq1/m.43168 comp24050_c2_seq1/g.43168  ORF comp24050_c2_seq1/g.43168 comp24050_c2_seq1/m.43168 type:complete len:323 (+) comp24050_c2_seq1:3790-4758(+)